MELCGLGKGPAASPHQDRDRQLALAWLNTAGDESEIHAGNADEPNPTMSPMKRKRGRSRHDAQTTTDISNTTKKPRSPVQPKTKRCLPWKYLKTLSEDSSSDSQGNDEALATQTTPLTRSRKRERDTRSSSAKKSPKKPRRRSRSESSSDESDSTFDSDEVSEPDGEWTGRDAVTSSFRGRRLTRGLRRRVGQESRLRRRTQPQRASSTSARPQGDVFALGATPPPPLRTQDKRSISGPRKKAFFQSSDSEQEEIVTTGEQCQVMVVVNGPNKEEDKREKKSVLDEDEEMEEPEISQPKTDSQDQSFQPTGETEERRMDEQLDQELEASWDPQDNLTPLENSGRSEQRTQNEGTTNQTMTDSQDASFHLTADTEQEEQDSGQNARQDEHGDQEESHDTTAEVGDSHPDMSLEKSCIQDESYQSPAEPEEEAQDTSGVRMSQNKEGGEEEESYELFVPQDDDDGEGEGEESYQETRLRVKEMSKVIEYRGYRPTGAVQQEGRVPEAATDTGAATAHDPVASNENGESSQNHEYMDIDDILSGQRDDRMDNQTAASDANEHIDEMAVDGPTATTEAASEQAVVVHKDATTNGYHSEMDDDSSSSSSEESEGEEIDGLMDHPAFKEASRVFDQEETWLEMVDESQKLLKKACQHLKPLTASLHELLASVQRARNAFNESINNGNFVEPDKNLIPDLDGKVSTVLSEIEVLPEEEFALMSPTERSRRRKSLHSQIRGIQTYVVPRMVEMIVPAAIIYHHLESSQVGRGLGEMRELFRLFYALCNETKPSRYIDEQQDKFTDRLKMMRPSARLLFYVYENELTRRLPKALPQGRRIDHQRPSMGATAEDAIGIVSKLPQRTTRSSSFEIESSPRAPPATRRLPWPKSTDATRKTQTKRTVEVRQNPPAVTMSPVSLRQQSRSRSARPASSSQLAEPSSKASPAATGIPLTDDNIKRMIDGLHSFTGPKRYEHIKQKYSGHFGKFSVSQIHALAVQLKPAILSDFQDRGVAPDPKEHGWFLSIK